MANRTKKKPLTGFGSTLDASALDSLPGAHHVVAAAPAGPAPRAPKEPAQKKQVKPAENPQVKGENAAEETKKVTILLPKSLHKKLHFYCYDADTSIQKYLVALVEKSFDVE